MKRLVILLLVLLTGMYQISNAYAQEIPGVGVVTGLVKRVIKAIDLQIQRQQNKVIWLQNAQKVLENAMAKLKLQDISEWTEKQKKLYEDYYQELWKVKMALSSAQKLRSVFGISVQLANEYKHAWSLLSRDKNFSTGDVNEMYRYYTGILDESLKNLDQLYLVSNSFATQMSDGKRLELIADAGERLEQNLTDLRKYNERNFRISVSRAAKAEDAQMLKRIYGLQ